MSSYLKKRVTVKRITALALAGVMLVSTACGKSKADDYEITEALLGNVDVEQLSSNRFTQLEPDGTKPLPEYKLDGYTLVAENDKLALYVKEEIATMRKKVLEMLEVSLDVFDHLNKTRLSSLTGLENEIDLLKKNLTTSHFSRLAEGKCNMAASPYYSSAVAGLERVADHLINVGYSIVNPVGDQMRN